MDGVDVFADDDEVKLEPAFAVYEEVLDGATSWGWLSLDLGTHDDTKLETSTISRAKI